MSTLPNVLKAWRAGWRSWGALAILGVIFLFQIIPLLATFGFSIATVWNRTLVPQGITAQWYQEATADPAFARSLTHTLLAVVAAVLLSALLVTPTLVWVHLYIPSLKPWLEFASIVPWALPGVVLSLALIRAYVAPWNVSRPLLLVLAYVLISLPFMFRAVDAVLSAIAVRDLVEAALMLGAGWGTIFRRILLPNIAGGVLSGALLVAAVASSEYVIAALMVGPAWETFPLFQAASQRVDGRIASALAMIGFATTWLISMALILFGRSGQRAGLANK